MPLPENLSPQLAVLVEEAPEGNECLHETKFDGYQLLAFVSKKQVRLVTRNGKDWSERFPGIVASSQDLGVTGAVLDGEAVALDSEGRSDFQRLQNTMKNRSTVQPVYYVFDLLFYEGRDLRQKRLTERKEELETIVSSRREGIVRFSAHVVGEGKHFLQEACKKKLEGIISKKADSGYAATRSRNWRKVKCGKRQELVIVGYTDPEGSRFGFGALALGFYDDAGNLVYCGRVGTGFDKGTLREIRARLEKMERKASPLATDLRGHEEKGMHWVTPKLVAEVRFTEWTDDGRLRHPAFLGLREEARRRHTQGVMTLRNEEFAEANLAGAVISPSSSAAWGMTEGVSGKTVAIQSHSPAPKSTRLTKDADD